MASENVSIAEDRQKLAPLLGAVMVAAAPHTQNLAAGVMAYFYLLAVWRLAALYYALVLPRKAWLLLLTLAGPVIVLAYYHRFWGQEAGSSLFIIGLGLKMMELNTRRDAYLVVFLAFFITLTQFLFSQSLPMAGYSLVVVILLVSAMIGLNCDQAFPFKARLKMAGLMVAQALPAMALLFVFFPRIPGPLWTLPREEHQGKTGLSDTLSPGSVSRVALSQETAFRVDFEGPPPPHNLLYWRGPVFWVTNGVSWYRSADSPLSADRRPHFLGGFYSYSVILEPHDQRWVFALDLPDAFPAELKETADYQLLSREDIVERKQYRLSSGTAYVTGALTERETRKGLQLPGEPSPRLKDLVRRWREKNPEAKQLVERALRYFREEKFYYTLSPPPTEGNPVEDFLFETRRGFCEHYATAFVVLMRLSGIPARVVTGYQGGQWNTVGKFLEVKQADAHAWAEVWLPGSGWSRVDPTAAVAPERIERGLSEATQTSSGEIRFNPFDRAGNKNPWHPNAFWLRARMIASSIDHAWARWVLGYNPESQGRLLRWLGLMDWRAMAGWLAAGLSLLLGVMAWAILPKRRVSQDPVNRLYGLFLEKLSRFGLIRGPGEGALAFAQRIRQSIPELAESADRITRLYLRIRYERFHGPDDLKKMRRLIKALPRRRVKWPG